MMLPRPSLAPAAAEAIRLAGLRQGPEFEIVFRCTWDDTAQTVTSAVPVFRGSRNKALFLAQQFLCGEMMLHTHPSGPIEPSELDLDAAASAAAHGVGFAITDPLAERLFLVTTPFDVTPRTTRTPTMDAWYAAIRRWHVTLFGRPIDLTVYPRTTPSLTPSRSPNV